MVRFGGQRQLSGPSRLTCRAPTILGHRMEIRVCPNSHFKAPSIRCGLRALNVLVAKNSTHETYMYFGSPIIRFSVPEITVRITVPFILDGLKNTTLRVASGGFGRGSDDEPARDLDSRLHGAPGLPELERCLCRTRAVCYLELIAVEGCRGHRQFRAVLYRDLENLPKRRDPTQALGKCIDQSGHA